MPLLKLCRAPEVVVVVGLLFAPNLSKDWGVNVPVGAPLGVTCSVGLADVDPGAGGV